jgi:plasmid stability protein
MKTTFRLPDELMQALRRRSDEEGRSVNETAIAVLWRGLGHEQPNGDVAQVLGSFVAQRARLSYEPGALRAALEPLGESARHLDEALDWTRSER